MDNYRMVSSLYSKSEFHDNCGFGLIAHQMGQPSHQLIQNAVTALTSMTHRGAISSDGKTGDGCGLLIQTPDDFLRKVSPIKLPTLYAAGMIFFSQSTNKQKKAKTVLASFLHQYQIDILGWRKVPTKYEILGEEAKQQLPVIEQVFTTPPKKMSQTEFEVALFMARRLTEEALQQDIDFHICSLSSKVISYKGLLMPHDLPCFYTDLNNQSFTSAIAIFHQRFSTNTTSRWSLAQPFRMLAHNGEINTIKGNRSWAEARAPLIQSKLCPELSKLSPQISQQGSDSYSLDNMLELLVQGGLSIFHALRLLIQPAWNNVSKISPELKAFYDFNNIHVEPWDGPAGLVMTEGRYAICALDRNGLRPARWVLTKDKLLTVASEAGVIQYDPKLVISKGRVGAGEILALDTQTGEIHQKHEIDNLLQKNFNYRKWIKARITQITSDSQYEETLTDAYLTSDKLSISKKMFLVTTEEYDSIFTPLVKNAQEPVSSMGDDVPLAVMSEQIRSPYDYFRQQFAQVTNPAMDSLRETIVMSLEVVLGQQNNLFPELKNASSPILSTSKYQTLLKQKTKKRLSIETISLNLAQNIPLKQAIKLLCQQAELAVKTKQSIIHLTDMDISPDKLPVHAVFAVSAIHQHLIEKRLRCYTSIIVETATTRDPHHFAVLLGLGASAIYPHLSYAMINDMMRSEHNEQSLFIACRNYRKAIKKGLLKIMSKMGISTMSSYQGAQLFEVIGLSEEIMLTCFKQLRCPISGASFDDFAHEQKQLATLAWQEEQPLQPGGVCKYMHKGEYHAFNPDIVQTLQKAVSTGQYDDYEQYSQLVNQRPPAMLRDLLALTPAPVPLSLETIEPVANIVKRFDSAAMSLGALSPEAHEGLAEAMNSLGGRSNSGEGGEDPARFGTAKVSKIKQIASGRFGVSPHYLVNAEVLQIKIAQGAKPGEGGQLPGEKVNQLIARLRFATLGVTLISPPPHHDIYSIEDLAQLIFDLKSINPKAKVSVKLVSGPGIGTIATGVAKAYADIITVSGHDGGTGASPLSSIRYAGSPWEIGLAEVQQALVSNHLREKIILQTDGGLKTGLDIIKAALLGADSFGFGTAPMVALGCKYLRNCHLNNCPTGIATQNSQLRERYYFGTKEKAINFFTFVAEEVRHWLAYLGFNTLSSIIGRTELLQQLPGNTTKQNQLNLSQLLSKKHTDEKTVWAYNNVHNTPHDKAKLAEKISRDCLSFIKNKTSGELAYTITNRDRSIGARLSGDIATLYGNQGMASHPITITLSGSAGQSFGVWNVGGLNLYLNGEANDYVGKGMTGGKIVIHTSTNNNGSIQPTTICGNTALYGATGGACFIAGCAGERFAVRNSGANAVVEGVGDHCCEYMTRGCITILGETGHNFGAGMTGGLAYVLDLELKFVDRYHHGSLDIMRISTEEMEDAKMHLYQIIKEHIQETDSHWAKEILEDFNYYIESFWLAMPKATNLNKLLAQTRGRPE